MLITVSCRCAVPRQVDTDKVGNYRLRCKACHEILYDPSTPVAPPPPAEDETQFQEWLQGSAELKVMMSSEEDPKQNRCRKHPKYSIVAACTRCERLLCKKCLDRVGDAFTCSECVAAQLGGGGKKGGLGGFIRRLFGGGK